MVWSDRMIAGGSNMMVTHKNVKHMKSPYKLFIIAGVLAIAGAFILANRQRGGSGRPEPEGRSISTTPSSSSSANGLRAGSDAIYVPDQAPSSMVTVGFVLLAHSGFVVIHEDAGGEPGAIVGASALMKAGETGNGGRITLSRESKDGEALYAMLHQDDGDGMFDAAKDLPVRDQSGNSIAMQFEIARDAAAPDGISL